MILIAKDVQYVYVARRVQVYTQCCVGAVVVGHDCMVTLHVSYIIPPVVRGIIVCRSIYRTTGRVGDSNDQTKPTYCRTTSEEVVSDGSGGTTTAPMCRN